MAAFSQRLGLGLALVVGLLLFGEVAGGLLALVFFWSAAEAVAGWFGVGVVLFVVLAGAFVGYQWLSQRKTEPSASVQAPHFAWFVVAFFIVLAVGQLFWMEDETHGAFGIPLLLGASIPPLMAIAVAIRRLAGPASWWQMAAGLFSGSTLSVNLAILLEVALPAILFALVIPLRETMSGILRADSLEELFYSEGFVLLLVELAVVAPLAEELVKPLGVWFLGKRLSSPRQAFLVGMAGGVGFAIVENMLYEGFAGPYWAGVTAMRGVGGVLHPLTAGLTALGVYGVVRREPGAWRRLLALYGLAVALHALWNGGLAVLYSSFGEHFFGAESWTFDIYGVGLPGAVLVLMALEVALMWRVLFIVTAQLRDPGAGEPAPLLALGLSDPRRLAWWACGLLLVLVPIGALWGPLIGRHLSRG